MPGVLSERAHQQTEVQTRLLAHLPQANMIYSSICLLPVGSDVGGVP